MTCLYMKCIIGFKCVNTQDPIGTWGIYLNTLTTTVPTLLCPEAAIYWCSMEKFRKIHRKIPVPKFIFH